MNSIKNVETLEDLVEALGEDKVDKLFIEYFMLLVAKSKKIEVPIEDKE